MAFWTYMLRCSDGRFYTGHTDNLEGRIAQHHSGAFQGYTSVRRPIELVWSETFSSRIEALEAERIVGGWSRAKKEALIRGDWSMVSHFARPPRKRFSTSLETNGKGIGSHRPDPFVSSDGSVERSREIEKPGPP